MASTKLERELKRGSAELLILALLEERQRHGYEIGQLIDARSRGTISFHVTSLYPTLYRLEDRGLRAGCLPSVPHFFRLFVPRSALRTPRFSRHFLPRSVNLMSLNSTRIFG